MNDVITHDRAVEIVTSMAQLMLEVQAPYRVHQERIAAAKMVLARLDHFRQQELKKLEMERAIDCDGMNDGE